MTSSCRRSCEKNYKRRPKQHFKSCQVCLLPPRIAQLLITEDSQLPTLDNFHTLVALDTSHQKSATVFGFPGWVYKATSSKNGKMYCLRRLEGENILSPKTTIEHCTDSIQVTV